MSYDLLTGYSMLVVEGRAELPNRGVNSPTANPASICLGKSQPQPQILLSYNLK